jgi:Ulp1 protease family, C-terminal catalytic domain
VRANSVRTNAKSNDFDPHPITLFLPSIVTGKDIFALDKVFFPINVGRSHWVCAVAYMQLKRIQFFDSLGADGMEYMEHLFRYLQDEHLDKKKGPLPDADEWKLIPCDPSETPQQLNGTFDIHPGGYFKDRAVVWNDLTYALLHSNSSFLPQGTIAGSSRACSPTLSARTARSSSSRSTSPSAESGSPWPFCKVKPLCEKSNVVRSMYGMRGG